MQNIFLSALDISDRMIYTMFDLTIFGGSVHSEHRGKQTSRPKKSVIPAGRQFGIILIA